MLRPPALVLVLALAALVNSAAVEAQTSDPSGGRQLPIRLQWKLTVGGQLYDDWAQVLSTSAPSTTHPSYPAAGRQSGAATWRCKECHGWDYRGVEGAFGDRGSPHYTGLPGITGAAGQPVAGIVALLRDRTHRYSRQLIGDEDLEKIATFVSLGQIDMSAQIEADSRRAKGDPTRGKYLYDIVCARCHGADGRAINFRTAADPEYMGALARANPWGLAHKSRYGQPGAGMISYGEFFERYASDLLLGPADIADLIAHAQALPAR